jgi:hypothetical protein
MFLARLTGPTVVLTRAAASRRSSIVKVGRRLKGLSIVEGAVRVTSGLGGLVGDPPDVVCGGEFTGVLSSDACDGVSNVPCSDTNAEAEATEEDGRGDAANGGVERGPAASEDAAGHGDAALDVVATKSAKDDVTVVMTVPVSAAVDVAMMRCSI